MVLECSVVMDEIFLRHDSFGRGKKTVREMIGTAAHAVQKPVFFARIIIIVSYLPIFTLQRVEGRLFRPLAWTVAFALLGALIFSMLLAPTVSSYLFRAKTREWRNPVLVFLTKGYRRTLTWSVDHRWVMTTIALASLAGVLYLARFVGSEFLPHLDEGASWARGHPAPSTGPGVSGGVMRAVPGVADLGVFRVIGQPNVNLVVTRAKTDRYGLNVSDIQDAVETAVGSKAVTQILKGERRYDLTVRYQEPYRNTI